MKEENINQVPNFNDLVHSVNAILKHILPAYDCLHNHDTVRLLKKLNQLLNTDVAKEYLDKFPDSITREEAIDYANMLRPTIEKHIDSEEFYNQLSEEEKKLYRIMTFELGYVDMENASYYSAPQLKKFNESVLKLTNK